MLLIVEREYDAWRNALRDEILNTAIQRIQRNTHTHIYI